MVQEGELSKKKRIERLEQRIRELETTQKELEDRVWKLETHRWETARWESPLPDSTSGNPVPRKWIVNCKTTLASEADL